MNILVCMFLGGRTGDGGRRVDRFALTKITSYPGVNKKYVQKK